MSHSKKTLSERWRTFADSYCKHSVLITQVLVAFLLGLILICTNVYGSSDRPHDDWQKDFHLLRQETVTQVASDFANAYQTQNLEVMKNTCTPLCLRTIPTKEDKTEEIEKALITVFGGEDVLNETIIADIRSFSEEVNASQIIHYEIQGQNIRDNIGTVLLYITERPDVLLIQDIDISEIVSKATSEYADSHRQELVTLYRNTNSETSVTKAVIEGIYKNILEGIKTEYQNIPIVENYYLITVQYDAETDKFLVSNMTKLSDAINEAEKTSEGTTETVIEPAEGETTAPTQEETPVAQEETTTEAKK